MRENMPSSVVGVVGVGMGGKYQRVLKGQQQQLTQPTVRQPNTAGKQKKRLPT
jgi:hypothetical protein